MTSRTLTTCDKCGAEIKLSNMNMDASFSGWFSVFIKENITALVMSDAAYDLCFSCKNRLKAWFNEKLDRTSCRET